MDVGMNGPPCGFGFELLIGFGLPGAPCARGGHHRDDLCSSNDERASTSLARNRCDRKVVDLRK